MSQHPSSIPTGNGASAPRYTPPPPGTRTAEQIRSDIVSQREDLSHTVDLLRSRWSQATDVGRQIEKHRSKLIAGAAAAGFIAGAVIAFRRRSS